MARTNRTTVSESKPSMMARLTGGRAGHIKTEQKTTTIHPTAQQTATRHHATAGTTGVRKSPRSHGGLFSRREPVVQQRKATTGDKVSGGLMKLKGSLTGRPGVKAAGTRRQHGTDGRGTHRVY